MQYTRYINLSQTIALYEQDSLRIKHCPTQQHTENENCVQL